MPSTMSDRLGAMRFERERAARVESITWLRDARRRAVLMTSTFTYINPLRGNVIHRAVAEGISSLPHGSTRGAVRHGIGYPVFLRRGASKGSPKRVEQR